MRTVVVTFDDGTQHTYANVPESVTREQVTARVAREFSTRRIANLERLAVGSAPGDIPTAPTAAQAAQGSRAPQAPAAVAAAPENPGGIVNNIIGAGETALTALTGAVGGTVGMAGGMLGGLTAAATGGSGAMTGREANKALEEVVVQAAQRFTYEPRTAAGQAQTAALGALAQNLIPLAGLTPQAAALSRGVAPAAAAATDATRAGASRGAQLAQQGARAVQERVQQMTGGAEAPAATRYGSVGAAAATEAARREATMQGLPVPVAGTRGAITRDAAQLAFEKEQIKNAELGTPLRNRAEENNRQLLGNFEVMVDQTGAQSVPLGPAATGRSVVGALMEGYREAKNRTRAAYTAALKSEEALAPVSLDGAIEFLNGQPRGVATSGLTDSARQFAVSLGVARMDDSGQLVPLRTDVKTAEAWRREVSQATGFDPVAQRQSGLLKEAIDTATAPVAGPLFTQARALRRKQAQVFEDRAIVADLITNRKGMADRKVDLDRVFNNVVLNGSPEEITRIKRVLVTRGERGQQAWNDLRGATVDWLKNQATERGVMGADDTRVVSPAKLRDAVLQLDRNGRLDIILGKKEAQTIRDLRDVAEYITTVPPGTLVNPSGTAGVILAAMAEAGANTALTGLPVPALTILRQLSVLREKKQLQRQIQEALNNQPKQRRVSPTQAPGPQTIQ